MPERAGQARIAAAFDLRASLSSARSRLVGGVDLASRGPPAARKRFVEVRAAPPGAPRRERVLVPRARRAGRR